MCTSMIDGRGVKNFLSGPGLFIAAILKQEILSVYPIMNIGIQQEKG